MKRTPIISGEGILNLIPQRPPIVMVDSFCGIEDDCSYSGLTVTDDNIFCQEGKLQEAGIIEHIAQSAAARIGYIYLQKNEPVPLGFIGSDRNYPLKLRLFRKYSTLLWYLLV